MKKKSIFVLLVIALGVTILFLQRSALSPRDRAQSEHGISLPPSATDIQCRGDASSLIATWIDIDRGASTIFEVKTSDIDLFEKQLHIITRSYPVNKSGDPTVNGYNVWTKGAQTFVPGNSIYGGFTKTWNKPLTPIEMLSCNSTTGDWLHVEIWRVDNTNSLIKLYTDWN